MAIKHYIPNSLTCANLLCGCIGIKFAYEGYLIWTAYLIGAALVFDFLDGFTARLLKVTSPIGKDLDSLADMVTFGVLPGVIMFQLMAVAINDMGSQNLFSLSPFTAFLISIFSALRLAKFNNDLRQSDSFIGVPTPAITMLIASFPLIMNNPLVHEPNSLTAYPPISIVNEAVSFTPNFADQLFSNIYVLIAISIVASFLLVAELPLFALKFKNFNWNDNKLRYTFLIACMVLLIIFKFAAIPLIIILYIGLSVVNNFTEKKKQS